MGRDNLNVVTEPFCHLVNADAVLNQQGRESVPAGMGSDPSKIINLFLANLLSLRSELLAGSLHQVFPRTAKVPTVTPVTMLHFRAENIGGV